MVGVGMLLAVLLVGVLVVGYLGASKRPGAAAPTGEVHERRSRLSPLTEAVGYVGAVLVLAGAATGIGQNWDRISDGGRVALLGSGAALFLLGGALLLDVADEAVGRLASVLWLVSAGLVAATVALATRQLAHRGGPVTLFVTGATTLAYCGVLWFQRRRALQVGALFVASIVAVLGVLAVSFESPTALAFSLSLGLLAVVWLALGALKLVEPRWVVLPLAVVLLVNSPSVALGDHGWLYAPAIVVAAVLMAASVPLRSTPMLAVGTIAMFAYLTSMLVRYFKDSLGVPAVLAIAGLLILALAVISARLAGATPRRRTGDVGRTRAEPWWRHLRHV